MTGIDNDIAFIGVIFVAARQHNRFGTFKGRTDNPGLQISMNTSGMESCPVLENNPLRDSFDLTKNARHWTSAP